MPSFLRAVDVFGANPNMRYVNYIDIKDSNREFLRSDNWDFKFIIPPAATYYPGDNYISVRLTEVTINTSTEIGDIVAMVRGFQIRQATSQKTNGTATLGFIDKEDQGISLFSDDWRNKIMDPSTRVSFRKEDTTCTSKFTLFNTSRVPVRSIMMFNNQPSNAPITPEKGDSEQDPSGLNTLDLELSFEHYERNFLNL